MLKAALALALLLAAVSANHTGEDGCLDNSIAVWATNQVGAINNIATLTSEANTEAEIISLLQKINEVIDTTYSRSFIGVHVGTANENFIGYYSCHYFAGSTCSSPEDKFFIVRCAHFNCTHVALRCTVRSHPLHARPHCATKLMKRNPPRSQE